MEILTLKNVERDHIFQALKYFEGNKAQTARALGISIKTLYNKLDEYKLEQTNSKNLISSKEQINTLENQGTLQKNNNKLQNLIKEVEQDSEQINEIISLYQKNQNSSLFKKEQLKTFSPWNKILSNKKLVKKYNDLVAENRLIKENLISRFKIG